MGKQTYLTPIQWGLILAEAWTQVDFRHKLEENPTEAIKTYAKERLGIELERVFQVPAPPADLAAEPLSASMTGFQMPATACGSGTAGPSQGAFMAPATACGSGTAGPSQGAFMAPATACGSGTSSGGSGGSGSGSSGT